MVFRRTRRFLAGMLLAACGAAATQPAGPATVPAYAVYSQVAREVTVVGFQGSTGTRIDNNTRQQIRVPDGALDKVIVVSAGKALRQAAPVSRVWMVAPTDEDLFDMLQNAGEGTRVTVPDDLAAAMREQGSTHLLLFTRYRAQADLRTRDGSEGAGQLEGLGFYVDRVTLMQRADTMEVGRGYLAPFAHFRASLIDVASRTVVRTRTSTYGVVVSSARATESTHPWDAMTSAEKINALRDIVQVEIDRMIPQLLARP